MLRLDLVVGPNGAGKSTFVRYTLAPRVPGSVFVNADEIARQRWPADPESHAYDAAKVAADTRSRLIANGTPFIAETVFSHPSKLALVTDAKTAGFTVILHVLLVPVELSVARVAHRVAAGGHSVPEDKIRDRHRRVWPLVASAIYLADESTVYDSATSHTPRAVAKFNEGIVVGATNWPAWTPKELCSHWPNSTA